MEKESKKISLVINVDTLKRIDKIAQKGDISRAQLMNNILEMGVGGLESCERIGLLQTTVLVRDMAHNVMEWAKKTKGKDKKLDDYQNYVEHKD